MSNVNFAISLLCCLLTASLLHGQDNKERNWQLTGYQKDLQTWLFLNDLPSDDFLQDNLLHNRLNFTWFSGEAWRLRADLRTRAFFGDVVQADPKFADRIGDANNDYLDLSVVLVDSRSWVIQTMLDRLYLEYSAEKWEVRLGRQRINWGISTIWNPNDIFNAYDFTDFDYEERPGSDALRLRYFTGFASSLEMAARLFDRWEEAIVAGLWKFNKGSYDIQLLGGYVTGDFVIGGGWAGNLGNAGWKGEVSWFLPQQEENEQSFALTTGWDYVFPSGFYLNNGYLYNSQGVTNADISGLFVFDLSAKNLYPYRHAVFVQGVYPLSPLVNLGGAIIYSPVEVHPLFINPTCTISMGTNWDLDLIGQLTFNENVQGNYVGPVQAVFVRVKYSFELE